EQSKAEIVLAGRTLEKVQALADQLNADFAGKRVAAVRADAANAASLKAAFRGVDLVLVAAPLTSAPYETVIRSALAAGVDYLDVQIGGKKLALLQSLAEEIKQAGRCFITEAGFHPGLPAALVRYAAAQMDSIESAVTAGYLNMGGSKLPYTDSVNELMEVFKEYQAQVYKNGKWTKAGSFDMRKIDFGGEIGMKNCYSMFFEELRPLPEMFPSLKEVGFYISETHWLLDWVISMVVMLGLKIAPKRSVRPLGKLFWWGMMNLPRPPYRVELTMVASGLRNGKQAKFQASVSHPDGYELTAIPVVALLLQYLEGSAKRPGLWMMGHLAEPKRLMIDMEKMGIQETTTLE
ncbi:MAG: saccharopine dehydrogenase NADP-binding domain-containing protein, partial [Chloroflexi bacterium]|nr:saccharopine dehydrogenase NADP-binding domain-containing protein [Chloroflexota bacterium]